jgi:hypothetical protein
MKDIIIIGGSTAAGCELQDEFIIPGYWNFLKMENFEIQRSQSHWKKIIMSLYNNKWEEYTRDCYKLSWPIKLQKKLNNINVHNYTSNKTGIDFYQSLYNGLKYEKLTYPLDELPNFKECVLESDLLIWQITYDPRFLLSPKNSVFFQHDFVVNTETKDLVKWKRIVCDKFFENMFDINRFISEKINFLNLIINKRRIIKKPTFLFSLHSSDLTDFGFDITEKDYVYYKGFNEYNLFNEMVKDVKDDPKLYCKLGHPSVKAHKEIENYIRNFIVSENLI